MFNLEEELKILPDKPGVYIMKDKNKEVIYVGKASVLKNRVRQYFRSSSNHSPKVEAMVSKISEFEYIVTDTELEALILECNLIKRFKPRFNILLKDDKHYPYIKITMAEEFPRILIARKIEKDKARYFGPYLNTSLIKDTISVIRKIFPIRTCARKISSDSSKFRPCLNLHIGNCIGPCTGNADKEKYNAMIKDICAFLSGKQEDIIKRLEEEMNEFSNKLEFEKAADIRDKISSVKKLANAQKAISTDGKDKDIIAFAKEETDSCIQIFYIRSGKLIGTEHFIFEGKGDVEGSELISSFIKQYYTSALYVPSEIVLQEKIEDIDIIEKWLSEKREYKVNIKVPKKGEKLKLIELGRKNAEFSLKQFKEKFIRESEKGFGNIKELSKFLDLNFFPERIEAYDISNTGDTEIVASMIVFQNGKALKKDYRRFKMKSINLQNDYGSMQEVIYRRIKYIKKELFNKNNANLEMNTQQETKEMKNKNDSFKKIPDLILVDGGAVHVKLTKEILAEFDIGIHVFGMVKDNKHKTKALVSEDKVYELEKNINMMRFITGIQDEAHRFAIEYNRKLRKNRYEKSVLDEIDGVGVNRKKALLKYFDSIKQIKEASVEELMKVEGINLNIAQNIYEHFRK